jgi:hypothetical protein
MRKEVVERACDEFPLARARILQQWVVDECVDSFGNSYKKKCDGANGIMIRLSVLV